MSPAPARLAAADVVQAALISSFESGTRFQDPYPHWIVSNLFPDDILDALLTLPLEAPELQVSGTREINNDLRRYFNEAHRHTYPAAWAVAEAFQRREVVNAIERVFNATLADTYLRIEYAQDTNGFWLTPHTDIGPKKLTLLAYISRDQDVDQGTDVYRSKDEHCKTVPYRSNTALVFVPSPHTWHGFEKRAIAGVRKSVIVNYVTAEWRAKEQLAYPETPVY